MPTMMVVVKSGEVVNELWPRTSAASWRMDGNDEGREAVKSLVDGLYRVSYYFARLRLHVTKVVRLDAKKEAARIESDLATKYGRIHMDGYLWGRHGYAAQASVDIRRSFRAAQLRFVRKAGGIAD